MARFIDLSDRAKGIVWRRHLAKVDWAAEMTRIEQEAAEIKATCDARTAERRLATLRQEWQSAKRSLNFVQTGKSW
jgi:hypothetical protein